MDKQLQKLTEETFVEPVPNALQKGWQDLTKKAAELPKQAAEQVKGFAAAILQGKETSIRDYVRIGRYYVAKRLLLLSGLLLAVLVYFVLINPPEAVSRLLNRTIVIHEKPGQAITASGWVKIYNPAGTLIYEGYLSEGLYDRSGKLYNAEGWLIYSGEFKSGVPNGFGEEYKDGKLVYRGAFEDGVYSGQGILFDGSRQKQFQGIFQNGKLEGPGLEYHAGGAVKYEGAFSNGQYSGKGKLFDPSGSVLYDGNFENGFYSGDGTDYHQNGLARYKGQFLDGKYNGSGSLMDPHGNLVYEGSFKNGQYSGSGIEYYRTGAVKYKGEFLLGAYAGQGELTTESGALQYKGAFANGLFHGNGELYSEKETLQYEGQFRKGAFDGIGTLFDKDEQPVYKGYFQEGQIYLPGFLGIAKSKLEDILEKPDEAPEGGADSSTNGASVSNSGGSTSSSSSTGSVGSTGSTGIKSPTDSAVHTHPQGTTSQPAPGEETLTYSEKHMSFSLTFAPVIPSKSSVSAVRVYDPAVLELVQNQLDGIFNKSTEQPPSSRQTLGGGTHAISYKIGEYMYSFFYRTAQEKPFMLEVRKAIPL
ncbi:hypothetical protein [Brevibacillus borstelensis]|uniref:MORN repeat-containing protein n=1 Tax=Brevibacillus borstelensis TaxID=45462 RepID=UPI0030BC8724